MQPAGQPSTSRTSAAAGRFWFRRIGALAGGIVFVLFILEIALQGAAAIADRRRAAKAREGLDPSIPTVLFVGDSHIYGYGLDRSHAVPAQLEALTKSQMRPPIQTINMGRNGAPTWVALDDAAEGIRVHAPAAIVARAGFNNIFAIRPEASLWWERLRIVKLARIGIYNITYGTVEAKVNNSEFVPIGKRWDELDGAHATDFIAFTQGRGSAARNFDEAIGPGIRDDIRKIANAARAAKANIYILGYLDDARPFDSLNGALRDAAARAQATFVDVREGLPADLAAEARAEFLMRDGHPTAKGYAIEAARLLEAFVKSGLVASGARR